MLREKVEGCFEGAAVSTGCEVEMEWLADTAKDDWEHGAHIYASASQRSYRSRVPCLWPLMALAAASAAVRDASTALYPDIYLHLPSASEAPDSVRQQELAHVNATVSLAVEMARRVTSRPAPPVYPFASVFNLKANFDDGNSACRVKMA